MEDAQNNKVEQIVEFVLFLDFIENLVSNRLMLIFKSNR